MSTDIDEVKTINELLDEFLKTENVNVPSIEVENITHRGRNYLGSIYRVQITGDNEYQKNFIVKCAPQNEMFREACCIREAYKREEQMYKETFPLFMQFQRERFIKHPFNSIAKYITSQCKIDGKETIVMENMCSGGFVDVDQKLALDYNHASLIMKEYGKFHAISFALKDQKPKLFETLAESTKESFFASSKGFVIGPYLVQADRALKTLDKGSRAYELFENFRNNKLELLLDVLREATQSEHVVIGHGDVKSNNMLFKYEDPKRPNFPTQLCLVDWQLARCGSPVLDLTHFLCICTDKEILNDHFDQLLRDYYQSLKSFMAELGSDAATIFPFEVLLEHFRKFSVFGLQMALLIIHLVTLSSEETPDITKMSDLEEEGVAKTTNSSLYETRIRDLILHFVERGFLDK